MGLLSGLGKVFSGAVKTILPSVAKAISPAVSNLLGGVTKDLFSKGAGFLSKALQASPLPNAFKALGEKLLGKGLEKLTQLAQGGIDKLLTKLTDAITKRFAPGVGNIQLPGLPGRIQDILANNPIAAAASAATGAAGAAGAATGAAPAAATGGAAPSAPATQAAGPSGGSIDRMPNPDNYDMESIKGQQKFNQDMMKFQQALQNMQSYFKAMTDMMKGQQGVQDKIAGNYGR